MPSRKARPSSKKARHPFREAHRHSLDNRDEIEKSDRCACFYCLAVFKPGDIQEWIWEGKDGVARTALCPKCGIDTVIGSASGIDLDPKFIEKMRDVYFRT
ncbi:MAG TPA: hypothetical protein VF950_29435 [Planctomycetota bacterium]